MTVAEIVAHLGERDRVYIVHLGTALLLGPQDVEVTDQHYPEADKLHGAFSRACRRLTVDGADLLQAVMVEAGA